MSWWGSNSSNINFKNWSDSVIHKIGDALEDARTEKTYKQIGRILKYADVPNNRGIYLFRDINDTKNIYCGKANDLRGRLAEHLTGQSGKLRKGEEYTIRWIECSNHHLSEAIAVIYFQPERNDGNDWKRGMRREDSQKILREAERLGVYSRDNQEDFCLKLLDYLSKEI